MIWWILSILVIIAFCLYVFHIWQTGRFQRHFMGIRLVSWMIALQIFGLLLMILAIILFYAVPNEATFAVAEALLRIGLICAIPPALFLTFYFLSKLLTPAEPDYTEEAKAVNHEWFEIQIAEQEERSDKAHEIIIRLEAEIAQRDGQINDLEQRLNQKDEQIAKLIEKGDGNFDSEKLAELEREKQELEREHAEVKQGQNDMSQEREEIMRERELLDAERARLAEDRKKFEELVAAKEAAEAEKAAVLVAQQEMEQQQEEARVQAQEEAGETEVPVIVALSEEDQERANQLKEEEFIKNEQLLEYERQIQALQVEQIKKTYELEAELDSLRGDLEKTQEEMAEQAQANEQNDAELERLRAEIAEERVRQEAENYRREQEIEERIAAEQDHTQIEALHAELEATREANVQMAEQFAAQENEQLSLALVRLQELESEKEDKKKRDAERRRAKVAMRRQMLSRENINIKISQYFVELSACFLMNRESYKDRFGVSPYNKIVVTEVGDKTKVEHLMAHTADKLYRFAEHLVDVEIFLTHPKLFSMYTDLVNEGTSLVRISEKLHHMYLQHHRKDFIKDYRYKEDFENLLVLASNYYVVSGMEFGHLFPNIPFDVNGVCEQEIAAYLDNDDIIRAFEEYFPNYADLGFTDLYQAMAVAFFAALRVVLAPERMVTIILKDAEKVAKELRKLKKPKPARKPRAPKVAPAE